MTNRSAAIFTRLLVYFSEAINLALFMFSVSAFVVLLGSINFLSSSPLTSRALMGLAMGATAVAIIFSPSGKLSGAHMNPGVTFTYFFLEKMSLVDAVAYTFSQFAGGILGMKLGIISFGKLLNSPPLNCAVTIPGQSGVIAAFLAEFVMGFILMFAVLFFSNTIYLAKFTPFVAGALVATFITIAAPISGMSINPARTSASAYSCHIWTSAWIYFLAGPLGMLLAGSIYKSVGQRHKVLCCKLMHDHRYKCIFFCNHSASSATHL